MSKPRSGQPGYICQRKLRHRPFGFVAVFDTDADGCEFDGRGVSIPNPPDRVAQRRSARYILVWDPAGPSDYRNPVGMPAGEEKRIASELMMECARNAVDFDATFNNIEPEEDWEG